MGLSSDVILVIPIFAGSVGIGFGQTWFENSDPCEVFGVDAALSTLLVFESVVLDCRGSASSTALLSQILEDWEHSEAVADCYQGEK